MLEFKVNVNILDCLDFYLKPLHPMKKCKVFAHNSGKLHTCACWSVAMSSIFLECSRVSVVRVLGRPYGHLQH